MCVVLFIAYFDYILVFNDKRYDTIKKEALELGYEPNRIINSTILEIPNFDFERYTKLLESPVTIVSQDCWAACIYSYLQLQFTSPFILFALSNEDYFKLLEDFDYYLGQPFQMESEANIPKGIWPVASLGKEGRKIYIQCFHYPDFESAKLAWEKRITRVNQDNFFVNVVLENKNQIQRFKNLPFKKKVAFCSEQTQDSEIVYLPRYIWRTTNKPDLFGYAFDAYLRDMNYLPLGCDILKMLNGERDFVLEK